MLHRQVVEKLLDDSTAVHLDRERVHVGEDRHQDAPLLLLTTVLDKLLDDVVPKHVGHQGELGARHLLPQPVLLIAGRRLQLLLYEPRAVLVLGELEDVTREVAEAEDRDLIAPETLEERGPELVRGAGGHGDQGLEARRLCEAAGVRDDWHVLMNLDARKLRYRVGYEEGGEGGSSGGGVAEIRGGQGLIRGQAPRRHRSPRRQWRAEGWGRGRDIPRYLNKIIPLSSEYE